LAERTQILCVEIDINKGDFDLYKTKENFQKFIKGEEKWLLKLDLQEWEIKNHLFIV